MKKLKPKIKERGFGVILEDIDSKMDLMLEGQRALGKRIDDLEIKVNSLEIKMNQRFDEVFEELRLIRSELKEKVGRDEFLVLEKRVASLEKRMAKA